MSYDIKYVDRIVVRQQADEWGGRRFNGKTGQYTTNNGETKDYTPNVGDSYVRNGYPDVSPLPHALIKAQLSTETWVGDNHDMACVGYNKKGEAPEERFVLGSYATYKALGDSYGALTGKGSGTRLSAQAWGDRMNMWKGMLGTCAALPGSGLTGVYCNAYIVIDIVVGEDIGGTGPDGTIYNPTGLNHVFAKVEQGHIHQEGIAADTGYTSDMYIGLDPWTYSYTGSQMVVTGGNPQKVRENYSVDVDDSGVYMLRLDDSSDMWGKILELAPESDGSRHTATKKELENLGLVDLGAYDSSKHARTMYVSKSDHDEPQGVDRGVMYVSIMGSYGVSNPVYANPAPILFPSSFDPHIFDVAYYPFAIRENGSWVSANRTGGSTTIRKSSSWRDVKNHTEESEAGDNKGFYRSGGKWVKAPLLG